ncbi:uncharacterized protein LOC110462545 [Mizuhopecten yessoensis]|uniref:uncharacterized protein LOC110462545 n=1 Tax=Mizuhopecten yessoensis TaxID=6573 RepID=UPI000B457E7A|nr:uncharacterized protein LOC110462545 [Mizuhopecten yessoensis]XP_021372206.1 uncharacterized protein LOC110462545 [Mizuhopecten yessoensis]XP_021372207.1 uncharacterized protein LOC110462545 [Mizuhopecten yessoensis]
MMAFYPGVSKGPTTYYHHTTVDGAKAIRQDGVIRRSTESGGDAKFGSGTYLTLLGPQYPAIVIANNNWDGLSLTQIAGRTDAVIEIEMPAQEADKVEKLQSSRDLHLYPGDLILKNKNYTIYIRDENGTALVYTQVSAR